MDYASGKYVYFLDADDYLDFKYIECMVNTIEDKNCDIVCNLSIRSVLNGKYTSSRLPNFQKDDFLGFQDKYTTIHTFPGVIWMRMYKKSFFDRYKIRFCNIHTDDVYFNTISTLYSEYTYIFYGEYYYYVIDNLSMTGVIDSLNRKDYEHIKAYDRIYDYLKSHNMKEDKLKLFCVYPFFKVDTQDKFDYYKQFFEKIKEDFYKNEIIYNDLEKFFAYSILNSNNYEFYINNYNKVVTIGFIKSGKKQ